MSSRQIRPRHPMPDFVRQALEEGGLMADYREHPAYQQNDYIGWIDRAKLQATKERRLNQMLEELEKGGIYMKMDHPPSKKKTERSVFRLPEDECPGRTRIKSGPFSGRPLEKDRFFS